MTQFQTSSVRRKSGDMDVYTGLLLVATIVLAIAATVLFMSNTEHSAVDGQAGGAFKLIG